MKPGTLRRWLVPVILLTAITTACRRSDQEPADSSTKEPTPAPVATSSTAGTAALDGAAVYAEHCAVCHMADGRGVPNMQPSLIGSPYVTGDPVKLEHVIRGGSAVLAADRPNPVANDMPPLGYLSPDEVKALIDYIKRAFGQAAPTRR